MEKIDLIMVNPGSGSQMYGELHSSLAGIEPPLWAALKAAFIRQHGYSVRVVDAEAENWGPENTSQEIIKHNPLLVDIVVLGSNPSASSTPKMTAAGELAKSLKILNPDIKIIFSGLHPSALPEKTLNEETTDFVSQGEGFQTILRLLDAMKLGKDLSDDRIPGLWYIQQAEVISNPPPPLVKPDDLPIAAWDLLPMDKYRAHNWHCFDHIDERQPYAAIYTSLGCPFNCSYCNIHALYNGRPGIRYRSPEKVAEEIDLLAQKYNVRNLKFLDELFAINEDRVDRICDLIIQGGHDLNIWAYARVDSVNEAILKKMKRAGINWLAYGIESASSEVRRGVTKKFDQDKITKAVTMTHTAGIRIIGNFIFGLPDDNMETMRQTLEMAKSLNLEYANFYTAMAYPGSALYDEAVAQGIPLPTVWHGYGQYAEETLPLPTKYLSAQEVLRFRDEAFQEYFRNSRYLTMIQNKFGPEVLAHIKDMLARPVKRKELHSYQEHFAENQQSVGA